LIFLRIWQNTLERLINYLRIENYLLTFMKEIWGEIVGVRIIVITFNQASNYKNTSRSIVEKRTTAERLVDRSDTAAQRRYSGLAYRQAGARNYC
jgi:ssDNA-specific exonuclease RecJ